MNMKKWLMVAMTVFATSFALTSDTAQASLLSQGDIIRLGNGPGSGNGGEFTVQKKVGNSWTSTLFNTFCIELTENISFNTGYKIGSIGTVTKVSQPKQLTAGTAALYRAFWDGYMSNASSIVIGSGLNQATYDFGANREDDARSMQLALWKSVGWNISGQSGSTAVKAKADKWYNFAVAVNNSVQNQYSTDNFQGVRILNLTGTNGVGNFQDQLFVIPEPSSMLVWGVTGLLVAGFGARRRRLA